MTNYFIPESEILNLYKGTLNNISTHSISKWLKSKTDQQFVVIERLFVVDVINYIEQYGFNDEFLGGNFKIKWDLDRIKFYL